MSSKNGYVPLGTQYAPSAASDEASVLPTDRQPRRVRLSLLLSICSSQLVLWLFTILFFVQRERGGFLKHISPLSTHSIDGYYPAAEAIRYREVDFSEYEIYKTRHGLPTNETDQAWKDLQGMSLGVIRASHESGFDIDRLPSTVHAKADPTQYMYSIDMYHQLHCLDRIRKSFYGDRYFKNESEEKRVWHREHCLDHIRQAIICNGDIALDYYWFDGEWNNIFVGTNVTHVCRDFSVMDSWADDHRWTKPN